MAQTPKPQIPDESDFVVLRAICMAGERVEVGSVVRMSRTLGTEATSAGKVAPYTGATPKATKKAAKPTDSQTQEAAP